MDMNTCQTESLLERELDTKNRFRVKQCPCGKNNADGKFVPYIGYEKEGYCHSCNQSIRSLQKPTNQLIRNHMKPSQQSPTYISTDMLDISLHQPIENNFSKFLFSTFGAEVARQLIRTYSIGTSDYWDGATVFPQIDIHGNIRTGKIILYDQTSCKRVKEPFNHIQWLHTISKNSDFNLKQCFFGEHLLKNAGSDTIISITESEKTALIASHYYPNQIWLGAGGKTGLTREKCRILQGRRVILFPDVSKSNDRVKAFDIWSEKANEFSDIANFCISDLLERKATNEEREAGLDLADFLLRYNYKKFRESTTFNGIPESFKKNYNYLLASFYEELEKSNSDINMKLMLVKELSNGLDMLETHGITWTIEQSLKGF